MQRPDQWPNVPYAAFIDAVGPSINADFLNRLEEGMQDVIGAQFGKSATLITDEFEELSYPSFKLGKFTEISQVNIVATAGTPIGPGDHGIAKVGAAVAGPASLLLRDNVSWLSTFDLMISAKALVSKRAILDTGSAAGFSVGIRNLPAVINQMIMFVAGNDFANWQLANEGVLYDTGVPVVDGQFYRFQAARKSGTVYAYIDGVLVVTVANATDYRNVCREVNFLSPGAGVNDGYSIDYHRVWYQR